MKTIVVFRKTKWEVIALFPQQPGSNDTRTCDSYMHTGQHGAAAASGHGWPLATPAEYEPLKRELVRIGYSLDIRKRAPSNSRQLRINATHSA